MAKSYAANKAAKEPVKQKFDISDEILTLMALMFLSDNQNIRKRILVKIAEFVNIIDEAQYYENEDLVWRTHLVRDISDAVLNHGATTLSSIEHKLNENTTYSDYHGAFIETFKSNIGFVVDGAVLSRMLSDEQVKYVDEYISTRLTFSYLWSASDTFRVISNKLDTCDTGNITQFNNNVLEFVEDLVIKGRKAKALSANEANDFYTGSQSFTDAIKYAYLVKNRPQSIIKTGVKFLNNLLNGGFEAQRLYVFFGRSGDWKSGILLNAALWACEQAVNPAYVTKDPTRKPCVIYLSMENDPTETIERIISYKLGSDYSIVGCELSELVNKLEDSFENDICRFAFKYRTSRSISTADIRSMIQDEYSNGYEVVMIAQDYIKRIRPQEKVLERHLELGNIVDDLSIIAKDYSIPVLTGMQLNRDAYVKMQTAVDSNKTDGVKSLSAANAGESINVIENADYVLFLNRITVESLHNQLFLTVNRVKSRGKKSEMNPFFGQPFMRNSDGTINEMRLLEDVNLPGDEAYGTRDIDKTIAESYDPNGNPEEPSLEPLAAKRPSRSSQPKRNAGGPKLVKASAVEDF